MIQGKKAVAAIFAVMVITTVTIVLTSVVLGYRDQNTYPSTFYIDGVAVGGHSRSQIKQILSVQLSSQSQRWYLKLPDKVITLDTGDYGIKVDKQATLERADNILKPDSGVSGIIEHSIMRGKKNNIAAVYSCNPEVLYKELNQLQEKVNRPAVNARILYDKGLLEYIPQKNGYILDLDTTVSKVCTALHNGYAGPIDAGIINLYPAVKIEDIKAVKNIIGAYAAVGVSNAAALQIQDLNGTIIMPGQIFTFPTQEHMSQGMETAMNAIMEACKDAGLRVLNTPSTTHMIIQNQLTNPVLISIIFCDGTMQIKVLGCQTEPGKEIHLTTEESEVLPQVEIKVDKALKPIERVIQQQGKPGTIVRTYRLVIIEGKTVEKTLLAQEIHPAIDTIIYQGLQAGVK